MKCYKSRGKPGQFHGNNKGAQYKRFKWKKNNFNNSAQAKFGVGLNQNDDDDNFNYNLITDPLEENTQEGRNQYGKSNLDLDNLNFDNFF